MRTNKNGRLRPNPVAHSRGAVIFGHAKTETRRLSTIPDYTAEATTMAEATDVPEAKTLASPEAPPTHVAVRVEVCHDLGDGPSTWDLRIKIYTELPTCAKHTIYVKPGQHRLSRWKGLLQDGGNLNWTVGDETGSVTTIWGGLVIVNSNAKAGLSFSVRVPLDAAREQLADALAEAERLGLTFVPEEATP
jgi:hypothetical protein